MPEPTIPHIPYTMYLPDTGEIIERGWCLTNDVENQQSLDHPTAVPIEGNFHPDEYYVLDGVPTLRPSLGLSPSIGLLADNVSELSFEVPSGTVAIFKGEEYDLDGTFAFSTPAIEQYIVQFIAPFPYIPHTMVINSHD